MSGELARDLKRKSEEIIDALRQLSRQRQKFDAVRQICSDEGAPGIVEKGGETKTDCRLKNRARNRL
jgi:hypothetical protein